MFDYEKSGTIIPKDALFTITSGEYSDYGVQCICRALADIAVDSARDEYLTLFPEQKKDYEFKRSVFINWLINTKKLAAEIPFFEFHIDSYSTEYFAVNSPEELAAERY
jgi:hypothetical protein